MVWERKNAICSKGFNAILRILNRSFVLFGTFSGLPVEDKCSQFSKVVDQQ